MIVRWTAPWGAWPAAPRAGRRRAGSIADVKLSRPRTLIAVAVVVLVVAGAGLTLFVTGRHRHENDGTAPSTNSSPALPRTAAGPVSLDGWQLSIPVENDKGNATTIRTAVLTAPWLTSTADGGLNFWAPTSGATTKNSDHPRTELDSLTNFTAGSGTHTLSASLTLLQVPQDGGGIILGQIHGAGDISSIPYVMLRFQNGTVRVVVKQVQQGTALINYPLLDDVDLNDQFSYSITDGGNGSLVFTATLNGETHQATAPVPAAFAGETVRFQAGDYQQSKNPGGPQDGGRVVFTQLAEQNTGS